jgi:hypothetical protein
MRYLVLLVGLGVSACSGTPTTELIVDKNIHALRPVMFYTQRMINEKNVPVVVDVTCAPKGNYKG